MKISICHPFFRSKGLNSVTGRPVLVAIFSLCAAVCFAQDPETDITNPNHRTATTPRTGKSHTTADLSSGNATMLNNAEKKAGEKHDLKTGQDQTPGEDKQRLEKVNPQKNKK